jgi:hypothetical protein
MKIRKTNPPMIEKRDRLFEYRGNSWFIDNACADCRGKWRLEISVYELPLTAIFMEVYVASVTSTIPPGNIAAVLAWMGADISLSVFIGVYSECIRIKPQHSGRSSIGFHSSYANGFLNNRGACEKKR